MLTVSGPGQCPSQTVHVSFAIPHLSTLMYNSSIDGRSGVPGIQGFKLSMTQAPKTKPRETPRTPPPSAVGPSPVLAPPEPMPLPRKRGGSVDQRPQDVHAAMVDVSRIFNGLH